MPATFDRPLSRATLCVHGRRVEGRPEVVQAIVQSATFRVDDEVYRKVEDGREDDVWIYSRYGNPTVRAVEERIAALEGAEESVLFGSGMAAMNAAVLALLEPGAHVLAAEQLYGGNLVLVRETLPRLGFSSTLVDATDEDAVRAALRPDTRLVLCESLSNPTMTVADLPALARLAHGAGALLVVDATFVTPLGQRPLELGADVVMHSASKYLSGHSDLVGGVLSGRKGTIAPVRKWLKNAGGCLDPHAAFLLDRGLKTLALRMRAHCDGAMILARHLANHPKVERVLYPGLESHPTHAAARELLGFFGGMLSLVVRGGDAAAVRFAHGLRIAVEAPSLGGVETLVSLPRYMSHAHVSAEERLALGIPPGMVRVSVGVEDPEDLVADFEQALQGI